jgi:hypothetical protein
MTMSPTVFLYGLSILGGIAFVAYGLRPQRPQRGASAGPCDCSLPGELAHPTGDALTLQFSGDRTAPDERLSEDTEDNRLIQAIPKRVQMESSPGETKSFMGALKAPLRIFSRGKRPLEGGLDTPVVTGIELPPKDST